MSNIDESLKSKIRSLIKQVVTTQHTDPNKRMLKEMPGRVLQILIRKEEVYTGIVYNFIVLTVANTVMYIVY